MDAHQHHHELTDLLTALGWDCHKGDPADPTQTGRSDFSEGIQTKVLRKQLNSLNAQVINMLGTRASLQVESAIEAISTISSANLLLCNELTTALLTDGYQTKSAKGHRALHLPFTLHYIDWQHPENNTFQAVEQYRVRPAHPHTQCHSALDTDLTVDLALFINGIPVVAISYADADDGPALKAAVATLRALTNRRYDSGETHHPEGTPSFYQSLQLFCAIGPQHGWYGFLDPGIDLDTSCALLHPLTIDQPPLAHLEASTNGAIFDHYYLLNLLHTFAHSRYNTVGPASAASILRQLTTTHPVSTH